MSAVTELKTNAEFEAWLNDHASQANAYARENDIAIRDLPIAAREYNLFRLNGVDYVSRLIPTIPSCIAEDAFIGTTARELRRDYLREHKQALIQYIMGSGQEETAEETAEVSDSNGIQPEEPLDMGSDVQIFCARRNKKLLLFSL